MRKDERERRRRAKHLAQKRRRRENVVKDAERRLSPPRILTFDTLSAHPIRFLPHASARTLKGPKT